MTWCLLLLFFTRWCVTPISWLSSLNSNLSIPCHHNLPPCGWVECVIATLCDDEGGGDGDIRLYSGRLIQLNRTKDTSQV
jgi:hypothetical protein